MLVPGYILHDELATGPGWRLFRALRTKNETRALIKITSNDREDQDASALLLGEHAILSQLMGEYPLAVSDVLRINDQVALIHEDFPGAPLSQTFEGGPLDIEELLQFATGLCGIMSSIHSKGLVHGFLFPGSILIERRSMRLKVTNFFLAQPPGLPTVLPPALGNHPSIVGYIAPEQSGRIERDVDERTDLYTVGVLLYQGLTGWAPFRSSDPMEVIYAHLARGAVPPHQVDARIPETLSHIIMTLLAKDPSDRYQSADLLRADIQRCREDIAAHGNISIFPLKSGSDGGHFELSQRLVGREYEMQRLEKALQLSTKGRMTALLIDGYAGVGKSALVQGLLPHIVRRDASFLRGKADQLQRDNPYAALSSAIRDFITQLLMENRQRLEYWQRRFDTYLKAVAGVVVRLVPEMAFFLSSDTTVESIPQSEAANRFREGMRRLFDALSSEEHPLVFFLDDLQWVDSETLHLLTAILEDDHPRHLLFIGAVRGHEIEEGQAAAAFLDSLERIDGYDGTLLLEALNLDQVSDLVSSALHCAPAQSLELTDIMFRKTRGNPFFLRQFLSVIHENGLIRFDEVSNRWLWKAGEIERLPYTENVVLLLSQRIQTWPEATQTSLATASFLGNSFAISSIAVAAGESEPLLEEQLRPALEARLLLPMEKGQKPGFQLPGKNGSDATFRFLHDRVQQAAYALVPENRRAAMHLGIGRRLLDFIDDVDREKYAFLLADQLNAGRSLISTDDEKRELARLNILAGTKAGASVAFASAASYFRVALDLLRDKWEEEFDLLWTATREIGRMEYALGNHESATAHFETMSLRARTPLETAEALAERVHLMIHFGRYNEALAYGGQGLKVLGYPVPDRVRRFHVVVELLRVRLATRGKTPASIASQAEMTDRKTRLAVDLMTRLLTAAYFASAETIGFFNLRMMRLVATSGMIDSAAYIFSQYGLVIGAGLGRHREALDFATTGVRMIEGTPFSYWKTRVYLATAAVVNHWTRDARENLPYLERATQSALECGDLLYGMYPGQFKVLTRHFLGDPVGNVLEDIESSLAYSRRNQLPTLSMLTFRELYRDLRGETSAAGEWDSDGFDAETVRSELEDSGDSASTAQFYILRMLSFLLADRSEEANAMREQAKRHFAGTMGQLSNVEYHTLSGLIAIAHLRTASGSRADLRIVKQSLKKLRRFEKNCAVNFASRRALLEAELCSVRGETLDALRCFESALDLAATKNDARTEALAARGAARTCLSSGLTESAAAYARRAVDAFGAMGAERYAAACFEEFALQDSRITRAVTTSPLSGSYADPAHSETSFDLGSLLKSAAVITSEIHLPDLVEKLLRIVVENAGAQHGVLFLEHDGELGAIARWDPDLQNIVHLDSLAIDETPDIPKRIVRLVARTQKQVLLDSAIASEQFGLDDDVLRRDIHSVLCLPVLYKSSLIGIVHLENNLNSGVFHTGRVEFLQLLSSQIASALENARLYARLEEARSALEQYSRDLESKVRERTHDLERRGEELQRALNDLQRTQTQLIQAEKMASLGELTAGIAHEIQNPLNFIRNFSELSIELVADLKTAAEATPGNSDTDSQIEDLTSLLDVSNKIRDYGLRIERIVRGMLDHSRSSNLVASKARINTLVAEALSLSYNGMRAKNEHFQVAIETSYDDRIPELDLIVLDVTRVFINIMNNSFFFLRQKAELGAADFQPLLSITTRLHDSDVEIRIRDNGPGIGPEAVNKVFHPFFTTKPAGEGTGLGLSISYTVIVEGHNGGMSVESIPGEWTEFTVRLPLR